MAQKDAKEIIRIALIWDKDKPIHRGHGDPEGSWWKDALLTQGNYWRKGAFKVTPWKSFYHNELPWSIAVYLGYNDEIVFPSLRTQQERYAFRTKSQAQTEARKLAAYIRKALAVKLGKELGGGRAAPATLVRSMVKVLKG
tara:strand:+ start:28 stop:450 length:423 start_codon:yes stop_codon:yes gene_type:complete